MCAENYKNDYYWKMLQFRVQEERIGRIFQILRRQGIEAILIKGWAAARNYPQPYERLAVDTDIAVNPRQYSACARLLAQENISGGVDLHRNLRHLDTVDWSDLYANAETLEIDGAAVRVLRAEDHLRVLCVHWLNDGGANRERLWDIYYAVEARTADFDWNRCLNTVSATRKRWIISTLAVAEKYLNLDLSNTPAAAAARAGNLPGWLTKTLEAEWKSDVKLKPLEKCLGGASRKHLWQQIKLRLPPNAIQATVETEGEFDESPRISNQIKSIIPRIKPSARNIFRELNRIYAKGK